jgi:hypothetical protein
MKSLHILPVLAITIVMAGCGSGSGGSSVIQSEYSVTDSIGVFQKYSTVSSIQYQLTTDKTSILLAEHTVPVSIAEGTPLYVDYLTNSSNMAIAGWGYVVNSDSTISLLCTLNTNENYAN